MVAKIITSASSSSPERSRLRRGLRGLVVAAALCLAFPSLVPSATAAPVKGQVRVSTEGGYVRLVFHLTEQVESEVRVSNGVLIVAFKRPVDVAVDRVTGSANEYFGAARRDPDGMAIRLALLRKVRVSSIVAAERLFVDLLPETWTGLAPGLPQEVIEELARRARDAEEKVRLAQPVQREQIERRVRVGHQPTFTRYVFDLPEKTGVAAERKASKLTLKFDKPLRFDLADAQAQLPSMVTSVNVSTTEDSAVVHFVFAEDAEVRTFREDNSYAVDVGAIEAKKGGVEASVLEGSAEYAEPGPEKAGAQRAAAEVSPSIAGTPAEQRGTEVSPPAGSQKTTAAAAPDKAATATGRLFSGSAAVETIRQGDNLHLNFPFSTSTAAAVFQRTDTLWLVFDTAAPIDLAALSSDSSRTIRNVAVNPSRNGQVVRIKLERPRLVSVRSEGTNWLLTIGDSITHAARPLMLTRSIVSSTRSSAVIPFENANDVHRLTDPEIGDVLLAITAPGPARGFAKGQDLVEFRVLPSIHGVVFQPIADDINPDLFTDKIVVTRPAGLSLSADSVASPRHVKLGPVILDPQIWDFDRAADFGERQSLLLRTAAGASENRRNAARLDLARFYLARGMAAEAKAVLDVVLSKERFTSDDTPALVLRGLASLLLYRADEAMKDLSQGVIGNQHDAPIWRAVAQARRGKYAEAREGFKNMAVAMAALPVELQRIAVQEAIHACIEVRDFASAGNLLNEFETIGLPNEMEPRISVLRGRLAEGLGRAQDALTAYSFAEQSADRPAAALARLRKAALRYSLGDLNRLELLSELETLTTIWRGDETELEALHIMERLYTEENRYRDALHVVRIALTAHPHAEVTRRIQDEAALTFESLFLAGKAESLPTIDALSIFYEFRDLTPIGRRGDEMIRRLADRLVGVDLLDQAAELLQYQVDHRLQGAARAQVATRLAIVYLMNRRPDRALATLRATRTAELANEVRHQRLMIEARALSGTNRHDVALEVISNIPGREAVRLRSDILWGARRWNEAAEQLEVLHGNRWQEWEPLNESERADILRAAIGFALAEDLIGLARFREKYAAKMADGPDRRAFEVVTAPAGSNGAEFRDVVKAIAAVDTLDGFLRDLRARFMETGTMTPVPSAVPGQQSSAADTPAASRRTTTR